MTMRVLLTGATGFLGSHIAEQLVARGDTVRAFVRKSSKVDALKSLGAEIAYGVLEHGKGIEEALSDVDAVIHCAGVVKALEAQTYHEVNAGGTQHIVDAIRKTNTKLKRFVLISSLEAFGPSRDGGHIPVESEPCNPPTHYGRSKVAAERVALAIKDEVPVTILRPTGIYGPRDTEMYQFYQAAAKGVMPLIAPRDGTFTVVYGPDCAAAALKALDVEHASGSIYFVSDGQIYTWAEGERIFRRIFGRVVALQIPRPIVKLAAAGAELVQRIRKQPGTFNRDKLGMLLAKHMNCSSEALQKDLGWKPTVFFEDGSRVTVDWYKKNGWL